MSTGQIAVIAGVVIVIIILVLAYTSNETSNVAEVEDTFDKEIQTIDIPEVQEKYDAIDITNDTSYKPVEREWQTSGPFQIDRKEYAIGEKIFMRIGGLGYEEKGEIAVVRPLNATHSKVYITIPFDGTQKGGFNYYLEPGISSTRGICSVDDISGKWVLVFRGTNYSNLNFEITKKVVPGTSVETVC